MKTITIAFALLLIASAMGQKAQVKNLIQTTSKAGDATDAAIQVLYDLRQANEDAQAQKDAENRTAQANGEAEIADLLEIADINKATGDRTTAHRKYIENEISSSRAYIEWIHQRRVDIANREVELQDQRCYSAQIFVRALKENDDALSAIALLRNDLFAAIDRKASTQDLVQIKQDSFSKLKAYKHLFDEQALKAFTQLADEDDDSDDETEVAPAGPVEEQINNLLDRLEEHFHTAIKSFEAAEVKAGWDFAVWLQDSEAELEYLEKEEERTEAYIDKMLIALQAAKATENKAWEIYFQSSSNYHNAITILRW